MAKRKRGKKKRSIRGMLGSIRDFGKSGRSKRAMELFVVRSGTGAPSKKTKNKLTPLVRVNSNQRVGHWRKKK